MFADLNMIYLCDVKVNMQEEDMKMMEYLARYGKASQKYRRNGKMQRQKRRILQKITAAVLSAALAV